LHASSSHELDVITSCATGKLILFCTFPPAHSVAMLQIYCTSCLIIATTSRLQCFFDARDFVSFAIPRYWADRSCVLGSGIMLGTSGYFDYAAS
jgi:hypothetical protein